MLNFNPLVNMTPKINLPILICLMGCSEEHIGYSEQATPTAAWSIPNGDSAFETGLDTAVLDMTNILPESTALGFGSAMECRANQCWITAPFGLEAELYLLTDQIELIGRFPQGTGISLSQTESQLYLSGQDGIYDSNGQINPIGRTGVISCIEDQCAATVQQGLLLDSLQSSHRPKAIGNDGESWFWQRENGSLQNSQGTISQWSGLEITVIQVIDNALWVGVPQENCVHRFDRRTLDHQEAWCHTAFGFGYSIDLISDSELLIGAPNAFGGKGYVGHWKDGIELWSQSDLDSGTGFGAQVHGFADKIIVGAPNANQGQGCLQLMDWP